MDGLATPGLKSLPSDARPREKLLARGPSALSDAELLALLLRTGMAKRALVIGAETFSRILDWEDRTTCVLFGDGAGAVVLEAPSAENAGEDAPGILCSRLHADGAQHDLLYVDGGPSTTQTVGHVRMRGPEVFRHAVVNLAAVLREVIEDAGVSVDAIDWVVPHQANARILDATAKKLGISPDKVVITVDRHANTSAASVPLALDVARKDGRIKAGDLVNIDVSAELNGYFADTGGTRVVPPTTPTKTQLVFAARYALEQALKEVRHGAKLNRIACDIGRNDALIQANRSLNVVSKLGVTEHIFFVNWLFNEQQIELIQALQKVEVVARVCGVCVNLEQQVVTKLFANHLHRLIIPARLNLELDAHIALGQIAGDEALKFIHAVHDSNRDARRHLVFGGPQISCQGCVCRAQLCVEN